MGTWKENLNRNGIRKISIDLTPVRELANSFIEWEGETPDNTSIKIETSIDGGNTWDECTNEEAIPNLPDNLEDVTLEVKQKLETKNSNETPILKYLKIKINTIKYVLHEGSGIGNGEHDSRVFYVWKVKHKGEGVGKGQHDSRVFYVWKVKHKGEGVGKGEHEANLVGRLLFRGRQTSK